MVSGTTNNTGDKKMTLSSLIYSFENHHGIGIVYGYSEFGFCLTRYIRHSGDLAFLPDSLTYDWAD